MRIYLINFIFLLVSAQFGSGQNGCAVEKCKKHGPEIRFPFRLKGLQSEHCGYPGFDLYCSPSHETVLDLPFPAKASINMTKLPYSVKFIIEDIDYTSQLITLSKVDGCLEGLLPQLNFSASPFQFWEYYGSEDGYAFFNCSTPKNTDYYHPIPCLSTSSDRVYAVAGGYYRLDIYRLVSCTKMFNISSIPYQLYNSGFGPIQLNWSEPACGRCEKEGKYCGFKNKSSTTHDTGCFPKELAPGASKTKKMKGVVIGLSSIGLVIFMLYCICTFKKKKEDQRRIELFLEDYRAQRPTRYTYADLKKITDQFKEKLGQGGYGTVYKGKLSNDVLVAVKVLKNFEGNREEFINEVGTIGRIHHINVVRLLGYCADGCRRGLVYEFLPNESLEKFISSGNQSRSLGWEKLQQIAVGIAKGLDYLHQGCNQRILHFDIKPHNILLDQNFNPKVADFGLAKLCSKEQSMVSMTAARGTIGYIAPEVFSRNYGNVSYKADIYSFGMLLLDMVGGRKNFNVAAKDDSEVYYPEWMYNQLEKGGEIAIQIDKEEDNKIFNKLAIVGLWCIQWYPADRPSMKVVIQMIEGDGIPKMPPNPFASTNSSAINARPRSTFYNTLESISEGD